VQTWLNVWQIVWARVAFPDKHVCFSTVCLYLMIVLQTLAVCQWSFCLHWSSLVTCEWSVVSKSVCGYGHTTFGISLIQVFVNLCELLQQRLVKVVFELGYMRDMFFTIFWPHGFCSTVHGLLDWFQIDGWFPEHIYHQINLCAVLLSVCYPLLSLSSCPYSVSDTACPAR